MFRVSRPLFVLAVTVVCVLTLGCGPKFPKTAIVRGKVTYKGKPVPNGTVNFIPGGGTNAKDAQGEIQPDGTYSLTSFRPGDGAIPGNYTVMIIAMQDQANRLPEDRSPLPPPIVPIKYTSLATSDLKATVEDKENTINFELKD